MCYKITFVRFLNTFTVSFAIPTYVAAFFLCITQLGVVNSKQPPLFAKVTKFSTIAYFQGAYIEPFSATTVLV
jgi:hypothetical protein